MTEKLKTDIISFTKFLGFDAVGVSSTVPQTWEQYKIWIDAGKHGEMGYLKKRLHERADPSFILEGAQSIIIVAKRYCPPKNAKQNNQNNPNGIVSCYAWGDDYHDIMGETLDQVCEWITEQTAGKHRARWCVDTAPLLERDFAAQAGIGWVGKHTSLLSRDLGNWFFLGSILTTLPLEPDQPVQAHCGSCQRCLDVCPTDAFEGPYQLDARKCISYLTIELKGFIPRELRRPMGTRIFGCDDCLAVCPWNRFARAANQMRFYPREGLESPDLIELMQLDESTFRRRFKGSPIKRAKRRGFLRNVAVALGNTGDLRSVPVLLKSLDDHEPLIRGHAAWALGEIGGTEALLGLKRAVAIETDTQVNTEIQLAIQKADRI